MLLCGQAPIEIAHHRLGRDGAIGHRLKGQDIGQRRQLLLGQRLYQLLIALGQLIDNIAGIDRKGVVFKGIELGLNRIPAQLFQPQHTPQPVLPLGAGRHG